MNIKHISVAVIFGWLAFLSCKKKDINPDNTYTGLKSISYTKVYFRDSGMAGYFYDTLRVAYDFAYSGSNVISVTPSVHPGYFGILNFSYSGSRVVGFSEFRYKNDNMADTQSYITADIHYNSQGRIDTIARRYGHNYFLDKYAFVYSGNNYQILYQPSGSQNYPWDTTYAYKYTVSDNITHLSMYNSYGYDYASSPFTNNLAGSVPVWLALSNIYNLEYRFSYPVAMSKNIINSWYSSFTATDRTTYSHTINQNRLTRSIVTTDYDNMVDTMFYEYR